MSTVDIEQAQKNLRELIAEVAQGARVVITQDKVPVAELVPVVRAKERPGFGCLRGMIHMSDDFDAPLEDIKEYME